MPGGEGCPAEAMNDGSVRVLATRGLTVTSSDVREVGMTATPGEYQPARPCRPLRSTPVWAGQMHELTLWAAMQGLKTGEAMAQASNPKSSHHLPGTNLTWGEVLRLVLLLCVVPWLFTAVLFVFRIVPWPKDAVGWIIAILSGPAAWGAFISTVADGRTLLGRSREPGTPRQRLWQVIRIEDRSVHQVVGGNQIVALGDVAEDHSTIAKGGSVGISGDNNVVVTGEVKGDVLGPGATKITQASGPATDGAALREAYLTRVLEQTRTLQLAGVDPEAAQDQTASTSLALAAVYTALMTQQTEQLEGGSGRSGPMPEREMARLSAVASLDRSPKLALLGDPGSGKSTFVNFVALCLAGEALQRTDANLQLLTTPLPQERSDRDKQPQPQPWRHGALLPVRVVLRDFAARGCRRLANRPTATIFGASSSPSWPRISANTRPTCERNSRSAGADPTGWSG